MNYPESLHFHIVGPQDATGDVGVMVGGLMYEGTLNDGECVIEVTNPDAGNYLAELYYEDTCVTYIEDVEVRKSTPRMTVEAEDTLFPNKAVVYVGLNMNESVGCTGDVHFNLNDTEYSAELNNSMARIDIPGIQVGNYQCTCYYDGDDNWNGTEGLIKFTVNPRE